MEYSGRQALGGRDENGLNGIKLQASEILNRYAGTNAEDFHSDDALLRIEIQDHSGLDLLRLYDGRFIEPKIKGIGFLVYCQSHDFLPSCPSKNSVTTRIGVALGFRTTRKYRPSCSGIALMYPQLPFS